MDEGDDAWSNCQLPNLPTRLVDRALERLRPLSVAGAGAPAPVASVANA